ncbi:leucine-rich repeat domain-containing protein [Neochlamydia sp. S13]|uniref:leucine-rich repeat domain-containing protein n=1 Tax=Neochlamydia sp. S13 TaxID=1353976 RepID=UPI000694C5DB|nr:leucine-rich repeat domain-containing protein [Neochlamydia sp. S13]BBI16258.1 Leucine rich repeat protein [Neochlamydia sp. S13]
MQPFSSTPIDHLPNELLIPILEECVTPPLFSICKRWQELVAIEILPSLYKKIAAMHVINGNEKQRTHLLDKIYQLDSKLATAEKVDRIFKQVFTLAKSLSPLEFKNKTEEKRYLTLANYSSYLLNINRLLIWEKIPEGKEYLAQEEIKLLSLEEKGKLFNQWIESYGKGIKVLDLSRLGLTYLPPEIGMLSPLVSLNLSQNQLTFLPKEIGQLTLLQNLNLSQNYLTFLPKEIGLFLQLISLNLNENQLTCLPKEIGDLHWLRHLNLSNNHLVSLPKEIQQLSRLYSLNLNQNQLSFLPREIGLIPGLGWLYLNHNQLTSFAMESGLFSQLYSLSLSHNQLTSFVIAMGQLFPMQNLDLSYNHLNTLPTSIDQLPQLLSLKTQGNPLENISEEIRQRFPPIE